MPAFGHNNQNQFLKAAWDVNKITNWQLYCILILLTVPVAFLEQPHRLIHIAHNNAWLTFIPVLLTGTALIKIYDLIIKKSSAPFPILLDEHLGKIIGRILGLFYIFVFLLTCAFNLRIFLEFMKMAVMPLTPVSIFLAAILLVGFIVIKTGLTGVARLSEYLYFFVIILPLLLVALTLAGNFHLERIYPIAFINYKNYVHGSFVATLILGKMMPVLTLAFFITDKNNAARVMFRIVITYVLLLAFAAFAIIVTLGTHPALNYVFPAFNMIRLIQIGDFLQNMDIIFVAVLIQSVFGAVLVSWWMTCFTTQKVFNLKEYRFVAAPTSLIIGVLALTISRNNLDLLIWSLDIMPLVFSLFFIVIPLFIWVICCFKPDTPAFKPADSPEILHKQKAVG